MKSKTNVNQRILIVEDDFHTSKILKTNLEKEGYEVDVARSGDNALDKLKLSVPDLIISDIMMPGLDGFALRNKLLLNPEHRIIPFIFLTAKGNIKEKIAGYKLYVDGYVVKPYEFPELLAQIKSILKKQEYYNDLIKFDSLTHLYNRETFFSGLEREINRSLRYNSKISFAILDLDHFKQCNDKFGHAFGDYVLIKVADVLGSSLRGTDFAGRYGGEEFMITMLNTNKDNAFKVVERLRKSVEHLQFNDSDFSITISAGIATFHEDGASVDDLMKAADKALYIAKESGRNKTIIANVEAEFNTFSA
jgi:two-component system, cell cycle response regulator